MTPQADLAEPTRVTWDADFAAGHELIDAQHQGLFDQCNRLADLCTGGAGEVSLRQFDQAFDRLKVLAREHCESEAALLAASGQALAEPEDALAECEEFEYLADEIATTANFDRLELQRFLALWCVGHVKASARQLREALATHLLAAAQR
ncbi:MAG: hemerythrin domain-containing protein [Rubrivivax sp.]|nr:hemerythrin domain-containing protein [Rubrivivax sp.]